MVPFMPAADAVMGASRCQTWGLRGVRLGSLFSIVQVGAGLLLCESVWFRLCRRLTWGLRGGGLRGVRLGASRCQTWFFVFDRGGFAVSDWGFAVSDLVLCFRSFRSAPGFCCVS